MFDWSEQQERAIEAVSRFLRDPERQLFYLAGYAGTGKTTLARHLAGEVSGLVLFAAYTGKAASVLRKKGAPEARTLHSILYDVSDGDRARLRELQGKLTEAQREREEATAAITKMMLDAEIKKLREEIRAESRKASGPRFSLNPDSILKDADLLVLDECSMVDERLGTDVLSFGRKVLVLGDPAQLPPVQGKGYFTSREPDVLLTEIHRQARGNPILRAAHAIREGRDVPYGEWGDFAHLHRDSVKMATYLPEQVDAGVQVLCGKNTTRRKINRHMRRVRSYGSPYPMAGETLVVLRNDNERGILNGVVCRAASDAFVDTEDGEAASVIVSLDYEGEMMPDLPMDRMPFDIYDDPELEELYNPGHNRHLVQADYGYALTVHKAQGSEWEKVLLIDDGFGAWKNGAWLRKKWLYTAITRASEKLVMVS